MRTIQASEAKTRFLSILDEIERGESVVITRHGKPVARIQPERDFDERKAKNAFAIIREIRQRTLPMSVDEILSARDEGRG
jgi:prevent-host-death family protein